MPSSPHHLHHSLTLFRVIPPRSNITRSPYDHRCKFLHDPRTINSHDHNVVVPDHCTKAKRNSNDIPDRLYHHRLTSIRQVNPLVAPHIWESCRPFRLTDAALARGPSMEFTDTYNLVCNSEPNAKILDWSAMAAASAPLAFGPIPLAALHELQRHYITLRMHGAGDNRKHLDFTYEPKDCEFQAALIFFSVIISVVPFAQPEYIMHSFRSICRAGVNGQPCMVLQTRYFYLKDINLLRQSSNEYIDIPHDEIVAEVTEQAYDAGKFSKLGAFVCAQEVAFDSKGKRSCNLSM